MNNNYFSPTHGTVYCSIWNLSKKLKTTKLRRQTNEGTISFRKASTMGFKERKDEETVFVIPISKNNKKIKNHILGYGSFGLVREINILRKKTFTGINGIKSQGFLRTTHALKTIEKESNFKREHTAYQYIQDRQLTEHIVPRKYSTVVNGKAHSKVSRIDSKTQKQTKLPTTVQKIHCLMEKVLPFDTYFKAVNLSNEEKFIIAKEILKLVTIFFERGVIIGDLKPENLAYSTGEVRLLDIDGCFNTNEKVAFTSRCTPDYVAPFVTSENDSDDTTCKHGTTFAAICTIYKLYMKKPLQDWNGEKVTSTLTDIIAKLKALPEDISTICINKIEEAYAELGLSEMFNQSQPVFRI